MRISELHTKLSTLTQHFTLIRSMSHVGNISNHFDAMHHLLSGQAMAPTDAPYLGFIVSRVQTQEHNIANYVWLIRCVGDPVSQRVFELHRESDVVRRRYGMHCCMSGQRKHGSWAIEIASPASLSDRLRLVTATRPFLSIYLFFEGRIFAIVRGRNATTIGEGEWLLTPGFGVPHPGAWGLLLDNPDTHALADTQRWVRVGDVDDALQAAGVVEGERLENDRAFVGVPRRHAFDGARPFRSGEGVVLDLDCLAHLEAAGPFLQNFSTDDLLAVLGELQSGELRTAPQHLADVDQ